MATPNERGAPQDAEDAQKTPPLKIPGQALWRAFAIVAAFVLAGSMLQVIQRDIGDAWYAWFSEILVVPSFILGVVVAGADYLRGRRR